MTTFEREIPAGPERAVFVADDDRRSRRLRTGIIAASAFALLWVVGLGIGMLGSGHLPGISLSIPGRGGGDQARDPKENSSRSERLAAERAAVVAGAQRRGSAELSRDSTTPGRRPGTAQGNARGGLVPGARRGAAPSPGGKPSAQPPTPVTTPQPVGRGLARRGLTAPPGQLRKSTRRQPAATPPDQTRRSKTPKAKSVTTQPPAAPPTETVPPGQQKPDKPPPKG